MLLYDFGQTISIKNVGQHDLNPIATLNLQLQASRFYVYMNQNRTAPQKWTKMRTEPSMSVFGDMVGLKLGG